MEPRSSIPSSRLSPVAVRVLDRLPDPPLTFDLDDVTAIVLELSAALRVEHGVGVAVATLPSMGDALLASDLLGELIAQEVVSWGGEGRAPGYVVHPEARPF